MTTVLLTIAAIALIMFIMALGVMITGRSLKGSCGGPSCQCQADGKPLGTCEVESTLPVEQR